MFLVDESTIRKDPFRPDVPIKMADGQVWFFPKPWVRFHPTVGPDGLPSLGSRTSLGKEFDLATEDVRKASEEEDNYLSILAMFAIARSMLRINYELTPEIEATILEYAPEDQDSKDRWDEILGVAMGNGPKLSTAGNDSP